jgi:hypothetical protein
MALQHSHIQVNGPMETAWLIFDVDCAGAAYAWEWAMLPPPTFIVVNPDNAHAHLFYGLKTPVCRSRLGRDAPIRYLAAVQAAYTKALNADNGYVGLIAKNPFHPQWNVICHHHLYDLAELAEYVELPDFIPKRETFGVGRNVTLFDELKAWSYRHVLENKKNGATIERWIATLRSRGESMNQFPIPLPNNEVHGIAKSIGRWTWCHFSEEKFSAIQSRRGTLGGRKKTTTKDGIPWIAAGISKSTYYRKLKTNLTN